jgi:tight adherence protein B
MNVMPPLVIGTLAFLTMLALGEGALERSIRGRLARARVQLLVPSDPRARTRSRNFVGGSLMITVMASAAGLRVAGLPGLLVGPVAGALLARARRRLHSHQRRDALERQLADFVESAALAVRTGYSVIQAMEFAASEADEPMAELAVLMAEERRLGVPFDDALGNFGDALASEDARLFTLIVSIHSKSGGNLAGALEEVGATIRHRISVRRELRAFTAQGRVSGAILGSLPIGFFLVLALTSRRELAPVYRSSAGITMIVAGVVMEALAFAWIRRLLQVEA